MYQVRLWYRPTYRKSKVRPIRVHHPHMLDLQVVRSQSNDMRQVRLQQSWDSWTVVNDSANDHLHSPIASNFS
jgi:hypothetical protein